MRYSLIPSVFMLVTSMTALVFQLIIYWDKQQYLLIAISLVLMGSAIFLTIEVLKIVQKKIEIKQ